MFDGFAGKFVRDLSALAEGERKCKNWREKLKIYALVTPYLLHILILYHIPCAIFTFPHIISKVFHLVYLFLPPQGKVLFFFINIKFSVDKYVINHSLRGICVNQIK